MVVKVGQKLNRERDGVSAKPLWALRTRMEIAENAGSNPETANCEKSLKSL